ncbi:hypothetical protein LINPERPRIM_LOCUS20633 [Linum perenne]
MKAGQEDVPKYDVDTSNGAKPLPKLKDPPATRIGLQIIARDDPVSKKDDSASTSAPSSSNSTVSAFCEESEAVNTSESINRLWMRRNSRLSSIQSSFPVAKNTLWMQDWQLGKKNSCVAGFWYTLSSTSSSTCQTSLMLIVEEEEEEAAITTSSLCFSSTWIGRITVLDIVVACGILHLC